MLLKAIGDMLPAALAVALSPFPVIAVVLVLATPQARSNGVAFALGWLAGLTGLVAIVLLVADGSDSPDGSTWVVIDWIRIAVGAAMIAVAVKKWRGRPRAGQKAELPGWMAKVEDVTPGRAARLGVMLAGANPKNIALSAAGAGTIVGAGLRGGDAAIAGVIFVLIGSATVLGAVIMKLVGGDRATPPLDSVKQFMLDNNLVIVMLLLVLLGAKIIGDGLQGLGH